MNKPTFHDFLKLRQCAHVALALLLTSTGLIAAPYGPEGMPVEFTQPDGTTISLRVFGDEFYGRTETADGYTVVFDPATKTYHYAALSPDGNEFASTGKVVSKADPKALGLGKRLEINAASRVAKVRKKVDAHEAVVKQQERWEKVKAANKNYRAFKEEVKKQEKAGKKGFVIPLGTVFPDSDIPPAPQMAAPAEGDGTVSPSPISPAPPSFTMTGDVVGLTILVDFSDVPGTVVTQTQVDDHFNKPNYTGFSQAGSVYDYFFIQSGGKLRYNNNVTYYVRVPKPKTYYNNTSIDAGLCGRSLLNDALNVLIANGYDFSNLSTKPGGYIRACNVFFAGADSGVWSYGLWPHRWVIPAKSVGGGKYVYDYQITEIGTTANLTIGTICHENGHMLLGYPDLYSYNGNAAAIDYYSLMSSGSYGGGGKHPTNIDSYLKEASGWMNVIDLTSTSHQRCTVQVDGNQVYRYRNPAKATEHFMFEVRDNTGWEGPYGGQTGSVNPGTGLVVYHANETGSNTFSSIFTEDNPNCDYGTPYELLLVEANQKTTITPWYDDPSPDTNDAFRVSGKSSISDATTPALKFWNATGRNTASGAVIHSISADGPTMTFVAGTGVPTGSASIALSRTTIDSFCDFGATASPQTFYVGNGGGGTLSYSISDNQTWLSCTPASGTATTESDAITVNFTTSGLAAGSYAATITVSDPAASPTTKTITVNLTVNAQAVIAASTASIYKSGISGTSGPQMSFAISNAGGGAMAYTVSNAQSWLSISPKSGTVVGETDTIYVDFNATLLARGTYTDTIIITCPQAANSPFSIPVTFDVNGLDMLLIAPNGGERWARGNTQNITWSSAIGGNVKIELFKNGVLNRTISASTPNDGLFSWPISNIQTLGSDYRIRVTSLETPTATDLSAADFTIAARPIYIATMDTNPGWTLQGAWAWGVPTGVSGDPTAGHTGSNVIGFNLSGAYAHNLAETHATTPTINCSKYSNVQLSFYRWLGIESGDSDKAYIRVSNDGTTWINVFAHNTSGNVTTQDTAWSRQTYDISAVADGEPTVYIRWTMGTTDAGANYSGWNIDDVVVDGDIQDGGAGVAITHSGDSTDVAEGGATDTYSITLITQPTADVTVTVSPDSQLTVLPTTRTFTTTNWATPQTVTVTAFDDLVNEFAHTGTITHSSTSTDSNYNEIAIDSLLVDITDNDNTAPLANAGLDQTVYLVGLPWSPENLNLVAWYDATDASTITQAGGSVSEWRSKVGTSHMLQATGSKQPSTGSTLINGLNSIAFDGFDDALKTAENPFGASVSNAMFMAVTNVGALTSSAMFSLTASTIDRWQGHATWGDSLLYFDCGGPTVPNRVAGPLGWSINQNKLLGFYCSTTENVQQVWADGANVLGDDTGHTVSTLSGITLGNDGTASYDNCRMGEVVILNGVVSTLERQKLEGHLAHKWGLQDSLPVDHPYIAQYPTNASVTVNLDGTVSDANGDELTTLWSLVSGPTSVSFGNAYAVDTTATFTAAGVYTLRLSASDPGATTTDDVVITVNPAVTGYTVTYLGTNSTGGTVPVDANLYSNGASVTVLGNTGALVRDGYTFNNWNTAANGLGTSYSPGDTYTITGYTTLFSQWTPNPYTITFDKQSGSGGSDSVTAIYGLAMPLATAPTRVGYTFAGYYTEVSGAGIQYYTASMASSRNWDIASDTTLYAHWKPLTYTVILDRQTGTGGTTSVTVTYGDPMPAANPPIRTGYTFGGYYSQVAGGGTQYYDAAMVSVTNWDRLANTILYAKWTANTLDVTFDANGGIDANPISKQVTYGLAYGLLASTSRAGYNFNGWFTAPLGGTMVTAATIVTIAENHTLYAQWTAHTYVVNYLGNGNSGGTVPTNQIKIHDVDLILATNSGNLNKLGYTMVGWNTAADGNGTDYAFSAIYTTDAPLTLYAKWVEGADGTWVQTSAGPFDWSNANNWRNKTIAAGIDRTASFTSNITVKQIVNLDAARTIGNITFTDSTIASHDLIISGTKVLTLALTSGMPTINVTQFGRTLTISSAIAGSNGLRKSGAGDLILNANNTFTGGVELNAGRFVIFEGMNANAFGGPANVITFTGDAAIYNSRNAFTISQGLTINNGVIATLSGADAENTIVNGTVTGSGELRISSASNTMSATLASTSNSHTGTLWIGSAAGALNVTVNSLADGSGKLKMGSGAGAMSLAFGASTPAPVTFNTRQLELAGSTGGITISNNASIPTNILTIVPNLAHALLSSGNKTLTLGGSNTGVNTFVGNIGNNGTSVTSISKTGLGTWALTGTNTYGNTTIAAGGGRLIFQGLQALPTNTTLTLTQNSSATSAVSLLSDNAGITTLNNTLNINHANTVLGINVFVGNNNTANGGSSSGATTDSAIAINKLAFSGLNNSQGLVGIGSVTGANGYRLQFNNVELPAFAFTSLVTWTARITANTAPVTLGGTIRQLAGTKGFATKPVLNLAGTHVGSNVTGVIRNAVDFPANTLSRPLSLTKTDAGTWTLSGANAYTGTTTVSAGKLLINGDQSLATGNASVAAGATLGGTGTIGGNTTIAATGKLEFDLSTDAASHNKLELAASKTLSFSGASVLTIASSGGAQIGTYTLLTAPGGISGVAPATLYLPAGWAATVSIVGNHLQLNVTSVGSLPVGLYANWASGSFVNGALANKDMAFDADGDGLATGIEWVIGGDPSLASDAVDIKPVCDTTTDPDYFIFSYRRTDAANADPKTSIAVEYSDSLSGWKTANHDGTNVIVTQINNAYGVGVDAVVVRIKRSFATSDNKLFGRLNVVITP